MMISEFWLLLLPVAAVSGWWIAFRQTRSKTIPLSRDYVVGLNHLLNEEPDKAFDVFVKLLKSDSEMIETHLTLGNLFRHRGEADRAIHIHQNLMARPTLTRNDRAQAILALALDYLSIGMLDRAEQLLKELIKSGHYVSTSLEYLLGIYEQEKEWHKAIYTARKLDNYSEETKRTTIAHYYCELAAHEIEKKNWSSVNQWLQQALAFDKNCARASLLYAKAEMEQKRFNRCIYYLKRIKNQNPDFLSEAIIPLVEAHQALNKIKDLVDYLKSILFEFPKIPIALMLSQQIRQWKGDKVAANFVADYVRQHPSIQGLHHLIELHLNLTEEGSKARKDLLILQGLTKKLLSNHFLYRCTHCGYSCNTLNWQCPRCKQWDTIKPVHTLDEL